MLFDQAFDTANCQDRRLVSLFPNLELITHGGINFAPYETAFNDLLEGSHAELREVYAASEGFIAVADRGSGEGMRLLLDNGLFFEFIEADQLDQPNPTRHWINDVQLDTNYALIVTSCAGLWSYAIGDLVRFVDLETPRILVAGRVSQTLSTFGEHITGEQLDIAVATAARHLGLHVNDFAVAPIHGTSDAVGHHRYVIETDREPRRRPRRARRQLPRRAERRLPHETGQQHRHRSPTSRHRAKRDLRILDGSQRTSRRPTQSPPSHHPTTTRPDHPNSLDTERPDRTRTWTDQVMTVSRFHVPAMDCAAEEQLIRMALDDRDDVDRIEFDSQQRDVLIEHRSTADAISEVLEPLGLGARHVDDTSDIGAAGDPVRERRALLIALIINAGFFVGELTVGLISRSMGLVADALDMGADASVYALSLAAVGTAAARKKRLARASGYVQLGLAAVGLVEVIRRFVVDTELPDPTSMIVLSALALAGNIVTLVVLNQVRSGEVHLQASWIFTANDIKVNALVITAAIGVIIFDSAIPDLIAGGFIFAVVANGARRILAMSR